MATQSDVRRIALSLPGVEEGATDFAFGVKVKEKAKGFAWVWKERVDPKKPRVPNPGVLAVRTTNVAHRDAMISASPRTFFTEPHYNGFPAVLVRLEAISVAELRPLLEEALKCIVAPPRRQRSAAKKSAGTTSAAKTSARKKAVAPTRRRAT
jgi:hypothetical protein